MTILSPVSKKAVTPRGRVLRVTWQQQSPPPHEFVAAICPEEDGFSVFAINYPGVISQGETVDEAKENVREAFLAMLESRRRRGEPMEFSVQSVVELPTDCTRHRIKVDG